MVKMKKILFILIFFLSFISNSQSGLLPIFTANNSQIVEDTREIRLVGAIMGQSNIDGRNALDSLPVDISNPSNTVKIYDGVWRDLDVTTTPYGDDPRDTYAHDAIMLNRLADTLSQTLYTVKKSAGGTSFQATDNIKGDWNINSTDIEDHYLPFIDRLNNAKTFVETVEDRRFVLAYLLVDIGETDSSLNNNALFKTDAKNFINAIIEWSGNPDLPVIWRELGINQTGVDQTNVDTQNEIASEIPNIVLIPNTGITMFDNVHLDVASTENVAMQVLQIVKNIYQSY